ncbi:restriction endonuclease [Streptococcus suis]|uniref:restriction endonuclease n=1 Tax=Streptococcus suis TaxID=1307 RepID=UPI0007A56B19|nr:restriction endonuclease [Streptococcus suis]MBL6440852.1 restriction endonuclease [Streptococcus suis]MBO4126324.1 restriction endonuclease [Streptococcus suis]WFA76145.1 restriction endonuclease [Streptococcus suis]
MTKISFEIQQQIIQCFGLCFHYKDTVVSFMQASGVPNHLILRWKSEPKFVWAKNVINELNKTENGRFIIRQIATEFYKMKNIPDEVQDRHRGLDALRKLKRMLGNTQQNNTNETSNNSYHRLKQEKKIQIRQQQIQKIEELKFEYYSLFSSENPQERGYRLEKIVANLFKVNEIDYHDSYRNSSNTQQLDGYFRFEGFDYLVEMKWEKNPVNSPKIASLKQKVDTKLTSTRGLFLSINGFRDEVIQDFANRDSKILFMDGQELSYILENRITLYEALKVKIVGASKTGNPYVSIVNQ